MGSLESCDFLTYPNLDKPKPNRMLSRDFIYPGFGLSKLNTCLAVFNLFLRRIKQ